MTSTTEGGNDKRAALNEEALRALGEDLTSAYRALLERRRRRARISRLVVLASASALAVTAAAAASVQLFGWPAPGHVKSEIAAVDQGMPDDLRLRPDVENAKAVAQSRSGSTLYMADLQGGGHCSEIVTSGDRGRGAVCHTSSELAAQPIELTLPSGENVSDNDPVTVGGRVNLGAASHLFVRYGEGGAIDEIPLGENGYFIFDVPNAHRLAAHRSSLVFSARNRGGATLATSSVPSDWDGPARPDTEQPIFVNTDSNARDFTKIYAISGHVNVAGAVAIQLDYQDGTSVTIPLQPSGSYSYELPSNRVDDFMTPQTLTARDTQGHALAQAPVAAVAYWRAHGR